VQPLEYAIEWTQITERVDEGTITVPVDYGDPQGATIDLYVARHRATADPSAGPMLANRGGPGADGATLALDATGWFGREITDSFDVIGWDPRGTGRSEGAVDCIDDAEYDTYFSAPGHHSRRRRAERALLVDLAESVRASLHRPCRHPGARRHEQLRPRHRRHPPGARCRAGVVLRVQLRQ
jgi:pimeloyl-ACP methyl ester carboxylesterase